MTEPITINIPHKLGRAAARAKLNSGTSQLAGIVPGGSLKEHRWDGDTLFFTIEALGQRVASKIEVFEDRVHATVDLPPFAALFASKIRESLKGIGTKLLR
jgi:hypothetical protein